MALSGTISASLTARDVVDTACELIGVKADGAALSAADAAVGLKHLNWMLKSWQTAGRNLWLTESFSVTWLASASSTALDPGYLRLENVYIRTSGVDRPLTNYSNADYAAIPNKSGAGTPVAYNVNRTRTTLEVRLWPVPSVNTDFHADGVRIIDDVTSLSQDIDVPQEWLETVYYNLAKRLSRVFQGLDPRVAADVATEADRLFANLSSFDEETGSLFFGADAGQ